MDVTLAELSKTTTAILAVRDLPAALEELRLLEEKHAAAVDNRAAAEAALEAAEKRQMEAYSAMDAQEMKMDATYEFLPDYKDAANTAEALAALIKRQRQAIADIEAIVQDAAKAVTQDVAKTNAEDVAKTNAEDATKTDVKEAAAGAKEATKITVEEVVKVTVAAAEITSSTIDVEADNVATPTSDEVVPNDLPPVIIVKTDKGGILVVTRTDIAEKWTTAPNIPNELFGSYTRDELDDNCRKLTQSVLNLFPVYHYIRDPMGPFVDELYTHFFSLMHLLHQRQGKYYTNIPEGYTSVFGYYETQSPDKLNELNAYCLTTHGGYKHFSLKPHDEGFFGVSDGKCRLVIPDKSYRDVPIWIHSSYTIAM